jgi:hypothetical protein
MLCQQKDCGDTQMPQAQHIARLQLAPYLHDHRDFFLCHKYLIEILIFDLCVFLCLGVPAVDAFRRVLEEAFQLTLRIESENIARSSCRIKKKSIDA